MGNYKGLLPNRKELIEKIKSMPLEETCLYFHNLPISEKKYIIMSELDDELKINLVKYSFSKIRIKTEDKEIIDYFLNSFIKSFKEGNKISLLLLINFIEESRLNNISFGYSKFIEQSNISHRVWVENGYIRSEEILSLARGQQETDSRSILFHEFGHYLFKKVLDSEHPIAYNNLKWNARSNIENEHYEKINDFLVKIDHFNKIIQEKLHSPEVIEHLKKKLFSILKKTISQNIIQYMKSNNYDESLIKNMEEYFTNLNIEDVSSIAIEYELGKLVPLMFRQAIGEYLCFEDLIGSIYGGNTDYIDPNTRISYLNGHSSEYYSGDSNLEFNEAIANFTAICLLGNMELLTFFKELVGEDMFAIFENVYLSFAVHGVDEDDTLLRDMIKNSLFSDSKRNLDTIISDYTKLSDEDIKMFIDRIIPVTYMAPEDYGKYNDTSQSSIESNDVFDIYTHTTDTMSQISLQELRNSTFINLTEDERRYVLNIDTLDRDVKLKMIINYGNYMFRDNNFDMSIYNDFIHHVIFLRSDPNYAYDVTNKLIRIKEIYPETSLEDLIYNSDKSRGGK